MCGYIEPQRNKLLKQRGVGYTEGWGEAPASRKSREARYTAQLLTSLLPPETAENSQQNPKDSHFRIPRFGEKYMEWLCISFSSSDWGTGGMGGEKRSKDADALGSMEGSRIPGWIRETIQNPNVSTSTAGAPPYPLTSTVTMFALQASKNKHLELSEVFEGCVCVVCVCVFFTNTATGFLWGRQNIGELMPPPSKAQPMTDNRWDEHPIPPSLLCVLSCLLEFPGGTEFYCPHKWPTPLHTLTCFLPFPSLSFLTPLSSTSAFWGYSPNKLRSLISLPQFLLLWKPNQLITEKNEIHTHMRSMNPGVRQLTKSQKRE